MLAVYQWGSTVVKVSAIIANERQNASFNSLKALISEIQGHVAMLKRVCLFWHPGAIPCWPAMQVTDRKYWHLL